MYFPFGNMPSEPIETTASHGITSNNYEYQDDSLSHSWNSRLRKKNQASTELTKLVDAQSKSQGAYISKQHVRGNIISRQI